MNSYLKTLNLKFSCVFFIAYFALALGCGTPAISPSFVGRIANGEEAIPNSWPWMAFLIVKISNESSFFAGTILDHDTILTNAYFLDMVKNLSDVSVYVGLHNKSAAFESNGYSVSQIHIHPGYNNMTWQNDVAIIKLNNSLNFSDQVSSICLPSPNSHASVYGKEVVVTGWGFTESGNSSTLLRQAKLKILNETYLELMSMFFKEFIPSEQYAVIEDTSTDKVDTNTCSEDSGGPLLYFDGTRWTIYGVTSYLFTGPSNQCLPNVPSFHQSVPFHLDFISNFLNSTSISNSSTTISTTDSSTTSTSNSSITTQSTNSTTTTSILESSTTTKPSTSWSNFSTSSSVLGCGRSAISPSFVSRIINGEEAMPNSWPWMVFLKGKVSEGYIPCGGTILNQDTILTSAYCVYTLENPSNLSVLIGLHNRSSTSENNIFVASQINIHPEFNPNTGANDVAVIKLNNYLNFSDQVSPICLPSPNSHASVYGKEVVVTGWGFTESGNLADLLQQAKLKIFNETYLQLIEIIFQGVNFTQHYAVVENISKDNADTNACYGDSGGPLILFDGHKWTIYGIQSFQYVDSSGKCMTNLPVIYQSVPFHSDFINSFLNSIGNITTVSLSSTTTSTTLTNLTSTSNSPTTTTLATETNSTSNSRITTWITGDPHVSSYNKGYQICTFYELEFLCFNSSHLTIYCTDRILTERFVTVLSQIRIVYNVNGSSFSYLANNASFSSTFSNGKTFISDELNNTLFEILESTNDLKTFVDYPSNTHVFISSWNSFYSLTFRTTEELYFSSTGVLVDGCTESNEFNATTQLTKRATLAECEQSCQTFANNSVESVEMTKKNIFDICFFDCKQVGNTSFTQMLSQSIQAVRAIQQTDASSVNDSTSTTLTSTSTSTRATIKSSTFKLKPTAFFHFLIILFTFIFV